MTESETNEPTGPLKGLRILDLTTVLFGPFGTQTLGDWGAEVIKIERLTGDTRRNSGQFRHRGALFPIDARQRWAAVRWVSPVDSLFFMVNGTAGSIDVRTKM